MSGYRAGVYTKESYQHCPPQRLCVPYPESATLLLDRFTKTGEPVATLSLRSRRAVGFPLDPSCTYIRVAPFGSVVTASSGRMLVSAALSEGLICHQVAPASVDRQTPRAYEPA